MLYYKSSFFNKLITILYFKMALNSQIIQNYIHFSIISTFFLSFINIIISIFFISFNNIKLICFNTIIIKWKIKIES